MNVIFDHSEQLAQSIFTFSFLAEDRVEYIAGQFTQIHLPHEQMDERGDKRWFTLSSSPTENLISITTKFAESRPSSFKMALKSLKPGTRLSLADPMGDFVLPKDPAIPLLFVAAGMGITPVRSMISELVANNSKRTTRLLHCVNKPEELIWREMLECSGIDYKPLVTSPSKVWRGETGRLSAGLLAELANEDKRQTVYISGPEIMVEELVGRLPELGVAHTRLMTDYFPGYEAI